MRSVLQQRWSGSGVTAKLKVTATHDLLHQQGFTSKNMEPDLLFVLSTDQTAVLPHTIEGALHSHCFFFFLIFSIFFSWKFYSRSLTVDDWIGYLFIDKFHIRNH